MHVSHSHRKTNRTFKPNIQKIKAEVNGSVKELKYVQNALSLTKLKSNLNLVGAH